MNQDTRQQKKHSGTNHEKYIHGMSKTRTFKTWMSMRTRCLNPKAPDYSRYGGRGIIVCDRWKVFLNFLEDMGERPIGKNIDRVNNNGNYCKENCRWATPKEQQQNRGVNVKFKGECADTASKRLGGGRALVSDRIRAGWVMEKAFTSKVMSQFRAKTNSRKIKNS